MLPYGKRRPSGGPAFDLKWVQQLVQAERLGFTRVAEQGALSLGYGLDDVRECLLGLNASEHFERTIVVQDPEPGRCAKMDEYRTQHTAFDDGPDRIYLKLCLTGAPMVLLVSFKNELGPV